MKKNDGVKAKKRNKILSIIVNVFLYLFLALCIFVLIIAISSKKDVDGAATVFGRQVRLIRSDSMAESEATDVSDFEIKDLPVKTLIFIETVPEDEAERADWYADLEVGDVLTFRYLFVSQETITHRITAITEKETGGYIIELKGDNAASETSAGVQTIDTSETESPNYVIGKVTGSSRVLGLLVYALKTPVGIGCIIILPCVIIIGVEIVRIVSVLSEEKRKKAKEETEKKQDEIDELKQQLAALKAAVDKSQEDKAKTVEERPEQTEKSEEKADETTEKTEEAEENSPTEEAANEENEENEKNEENKAGNEDNEDKGETEKKQGEKTDEPLTVEEKTEKGEEK
ncbi:MAG: hypothetical protein IJ317_00770 [Clostridia bacterium]|nr:hypothetical protein [Clostridia bacterium]